MLLFGFRGLGFRAREEVCVGFATRANAFLRAPDTKYPNPQALNPKP